MRTFYIDVYFLINFTVDVLSLYFAAIFSKIPSSPRRLIFSSVIGALISIAIVFLPEIPVLKFCIAAISLIVMGLIAGGKVRLKRKTKFIFAFLIFEALVGGAVSFLWGILDKYLYDLFASAEGGAVNRKMLFFSLIVLLSIGVFKMLVSFFSNIESEGSVKLKIDFFEKSIEVEAFVDSGNLAIDPMDMRPVLLLKSDVAKQLFPESVINLRDPDMIDSGIRKRIRLIPISKGGSTHVLTGVRADSVKIIKRDGEEKIGVTIAIDKEGGDFGGFAALMPSAALENVVL